MSTYDELKRNMAEVGAMQDELKCRAMVYQVSEKEYIAKLVGLPFDSIYHVSYEDYSSISSLVKMFEDKAYKHYDLFREEVEQYYKDNKDKMLCPNDGLVMGDIWNYYWTKNPVDLKRIRNTCLDSIERINKE
jgi:signal peptidase I